MYEGFWLVKFWESLSTVKGLTCDDLLDKVLKISTPDSYANQMLASLGTTKTVAERMAVYPIRENSRKHRVSLPLHCVLVLIEELC